MLSNSSTITDDGHERRTPINPRGCVVNSYGTTLAELVRRPKDDQRLEDSL